MAHLSAISLLSEATVVILCILSRQVTADFELCHPGPTTPYKLYKFTRANCPYGVLFNQPIISQCLIATDQIIDFMSDLCDSEKYRLEADKPPFKIQFALIMDDNPVGEGDNEGCTGELPDKCNETEIVEVTNALLTEPEDMEAEDDSLTDADKAGFNDTDVAEQTERLFKFMFGLIEDPSEKSHQMRIVDLLSQSFRILAKFCDARFVPTAFGMDVSRAFLFLVREAELSKTTDISPADYNAIKIALDNCEGMQPAFNLSGKTCKTYAQVATIEKGGRTHKYTRNDLSFQWGKYDIPVDATWGALSFVHGLCYGTFKTYVNFHHLFQRAVELLFTFEIVHRWGHPPKLYHDDLWDNALSANVRNAMSNLDACVHAAYLDVPFLHRLERPLAMEKENKTDPGTALSSGSTIRRKKRSLPSAYLDDIGLAGSGWCFQNEQDMTKTTEAYVKTNCPDVTKTLEEIKRLVESLNSTKESDDGGMPADTN